MRMRVCGMRTGIAAAVLAIGVQATTIDSVITYVGATLGKVKEYRADAMIVRYL